MDSMYLIILLVLGATVSASVFLARSLLMNEPREIVKQVGIWLGIVTLLPLAAWYGTSVFWPPPDWKGHQKQVSRLQDRMRADNTKKETEELLQEKERLEDDLEGAEKVYYRAMFRVCYPVGLFAVLIGLFFRVQVIGAGLLFGGLATLTAGCYSYWDQMDAWLRFGSLLLALTALLVLGMWRYRRPGAALSPV